MPFYSVRATCHCPVWYGILVCFNSSRCLCFVSLKQFWTNCVVSINHFSLYSCWPYEFTWAPASLYASSCFTIFGHHHFSSSKFNSNFKKKEDLERRSFYFVSEVFFDSSSSSILTVWQPWVSLKCIGVAVTVHPYLFSQSGATILEKDRREQNWLNKNAKFSWKNCVVLELRIRFFWHLIVGLATRRLETRFECGTAVKIRKNWKCPRVFRVPKMTSSPVESYGDASWFFRDSRICMNLFPSSSCFFHSIECLQLFLFLDDVMASLPRRPIRCRVYWRLLGDQDLECVTVTI